MCICMHEHDTCDAYTYIHTCMYILHVYTYIYPFCVAGTVIFLGLKSHLSPLLPSPLWTVVRSLLSAGDFCLNIRRARENPHEARFVPTFFGFETCSRRLFFCQSWKSPKEF